VGVGFENAIGLGLEVIPLGEVNEVQGAGDGQSAVTILAFKDGNRGFQLMVKKGRSAIGFQDFVDTCVQRPSLRTDFDPHLSSGLSGVINPLP
jgi:hypothetical protein